MVAKSRRRQWGLLLLASAWPAYYLWSGRLGEAGWSALVLGFLLVGQYVQSAKRPSIVAAHALNWSIPILVFAGCVNRALVRDYWGVAFFAIGFGFTVVNAVYLYPSARRTRLFRGLIGMLVVVSAAAVWRTVTR